MNFRTSFKTILEIGLLISICLFLSCCQNSCDPGMENVKRGLSFSSSYLGSVKYTIYLPPGYKENLTERYPVVFLLHGFFWRVRSSVFSEAIALIFCSIKSTGQGLLKQAAARPLLINCKRKFSPGLARQRIIALVPEVLVCRFCRKD